MTKENEMITSKVLVLRPENILNNSAAQIYVGKLINTYFENIEEIIILLPDSQRGDIKKLREVPIETLKLLSISNPKKIVTIQSAFYSKYSWKKYNQLNNLLKFDKEDPSLLINYSAPFEQFFNDKHFYRKVMWKRFLQRIHNWKINLKNFFKAISNLFLGDLIVYIKKYIEISKLEKSICRKEMNLKLGFIPTHEIDTTNEQINKSKEKIEKCKERQQESSRGFTTLLISILTICIYTQQCQISKKQTVLQENQTSILEKQLSMEKNLNLPKFNIYVSYSDDQKSENIYIKQINDAYISSFLFQPSIICQIKTSDNKIIFKRISDYYKDALLSIEDRNGKYGLIGSDNITRWNEIKKELSNYIESIELERIIKLTYTDYENNNHEQYFFVIPFLGEDEWDGQLGKRFFEKDIEDLTMSQLLDYLKQINILQSGETIIKQGM